MSGQREGAWREQPLWVCLLGATWALRKASKLFKRADCLQETDLPTKKLWGRSCRGSWSALPSQDGIARRSQEPCE